MMNSSNNIVGVIVVTCRLGKYVESCLDSLNKQTYSRLEIVVVDNSLSQNLRRTLLKNYPSIKLYSSPKNLSYCNSLNIGISLTQTEFVLCLNDDVILDSQFIEKGLGGFSIEPRIGMVSGKVLRWDKVTLDTIGLFLSAWRTAYERGYGIKDKGQFQKQGYIFGVNGAVAFYRRIMLEEIKEGDNYFDSDFCFFYEDLDVAWRAQHKGWKGYYVPEAIAYHLRGGSTRKLQGIGKPYARLYLNEELQAHLLKNRYIVLIKNESLLGFLLHIPFLLFYEIMVWSYILTLRPHQIKLFFRNFIYIKSALRKRRKIRQAHISELPL
ncbi:MAG: glycosyltransferase [Candidatus Omnitrophica bacterium]|nr:glycosyltransferase [Candidatus Omnitrophota bacterium]